MSDFTASSLSSGQKGVCFRVFVVLVGSTMRRLVG